MAYKRTPSSPYYPPPSSKHHPSSKSLPISPISPKTDATATAPLPEISRFGASLTKSSHSVSVSDPHVTSSASLLPYSKLIATPPHENPSVASCSSLPALRNLAPAEQAARTHSPCTQIAHS